MTLARAAPYAARASTARRRRSCVLDTCGLICRARVDERKWKKLEDVRRAILRVVEGETVVELPCAGTAQALADAVRDGAADAVGTLAQDVVDARSPSHVLIPRGARIQLPVDLTTPKG